MSNQDLADKVGLSASPCLRRVKQLEASGMIRGYVALLDQEALQLHLTVMVSVALSTHDPAVLKSFEHVMKRLDEVVACFMIAGQKSDYLLKVVAPDLKSYQSFLLNKIMVIEGVDQVLSSFVLNTVLDDTALPIP